MIFISSKQKEAEMVGLRRRGFVPAGQSPSPSGNIKSPQQRFSKAKEASYGSFLLSGKALRILWRSFCLGAVLGLLFVGLFLSGAYLISGNGVTKAHQLGLSLGNTLFKSRELSAVPQPGMSSETLHVRHKEILVKGLPALLIKSEREEEVFSGVTGDFLHGRVGMDLSGAPLWRPGPHPESQTPEQLEESFRGYCFNTALSDSLSLDRPVPSFDSPACAERRASFSLGNTASGEAAKVSKASVVVVFHNENLSVLLRSIHSVLNRTPPSLLEEIILVNDFSDLQTHPWLGKQLETYVAFGLPKTKLLRLEQRRGLMGARAAGAAIAKGDVLMFLDSHVEVLPFWLEPLLQRIGESSKTAALPRIASIEADTFEIVNGGIDTLAFNWSLGHMHRDDEIKGRESNKHKKEGDPIESPIMPGGIFAISREWWNTLGGYDEGLRLYAGEEFELSFKVWMCGGKLEVLTCSKVAHVFRSDKYWKGQVYPVPGEEIARNKQRAAHVWMDKYVQYVLLTTPPVSAEFLGDLTPQKALRDKLQCKSFQWYLDNVYPELEAPSLETSLTGAVVRSDINACLDTMQGERGEIGAFPCHFSHGTQAFLFDGSTGRLFVGQKGFNSCVGGDPVSRWVVQLKCTDSMEGIAMRWTYSQDDQQLRLLVDKPIDVHQAANASEPEETAAAAAAAPLCLRLFSFPTDESPHAVELAPCDPQDVGQRLNFVP